MPRQPLSSVASLRPQGPPRSWSNDGCELGEAPAPKRCAGSLSLFAASDINRSGWGCALGAENSQTGEPLEPDPGHAGVGKPKRPNDRWSAESRFPGRPGGGFFVGAAKNSSAFTITLNGEPYRVDGAARLSALIV